MLLQRKFILATIFTSAILLTVFIIFQQKEELGEVTQAPEESANLMQKLLALKKEIVDLRGFERTENALAAIDDLLKQLNSPYSTNQSSIEPEVCVDEYVETRTAKSGRTHSWVRRNCKKDQDIGTLVTIILNPNPSSIGNCTVYLSWVLDGIKQHIPTVKVIIAYRNSACRIDKSKLTDTMQVIDFPSNTSEGKVWNSLISSVETKYICIARGVDHFNSFANLHRQISIFSIDERIKIVGGASRNITGHWRMGCYQSEMKNYILEYKDGYFKSRNECAVCDHTLGPFIVLADYAKKIRFDEVISKSVLFEDFFLRVKSDGATTMVCPDVMYFATDYDYNARFSDRTSWLTLTKKWQLNRILLPLKVKFSYDCSESGITCKDAMKRPAVSRYLIPPCCLTQYKSAWKFLQDFAERHNFTFQLGAGSALAAVKFSSDLPWDLDGDLDYPSAYFNVIMDAEKSFKEHGFKLRVNTETKFSPDEYGLTEGYIVLETPDATIDLFGERLLASNLLPSELWDVPTRVKMGDVWVFAHPNPGMLARDIYGVECLRHAQSYAITGTGSSSASYKAGHFAACPKPHHACLDQFNTDGNFQYFVP